MADKDAAKVVIIKRKNVIAGGHHGGAWKVAYADFVTAMMAFFLLMWLLSTTDDQTKLGLADYFSPTIPIHSTSGGGDGPFNGSSMFDENTLAQDETGHEGDPEKLDVEGAPDDNLWEIEKALRETMDGDAFDADPLFDHIRTRITDEGLIIDIFDVEGSPLFEGLGATHRPILDDLMSMIGRVLARTQNSVAIAGHLSASDVANPAVDPWRLSGDRAQKARDLVVAAGIDDSRMQRVAGRSDRSPVPDQTEEERNRRIEITLLRTIAQ